MEKVKAEDLLTYRFLSGVRISPDGALAAFIVKRMRREENDYASDIYVVDLASGAVRRLTTSGKDGPFAWSADSRAIVFVSRREEKDEEEKEVSPVYRIAVDGGEAERVGTIPHKAESLDLLDDGRLLYSARVPLYERSEDDKDYEVLDEIPFWSNGVGFTNKRRRHLFAFDLVAEKEEELVTGTFNVAGFDVRGTRIAYVGKDFTDKAGLTDELWALDLATGERTCLSKDELELSGPRFLRDDRIAVLGTDMQHYGLNENSEVLVFDLGGRGFSSLTPGWDRSTGNSVNSDVRHGGGPTLRADGDAIYVTVTEDDSCYLDRIAPDGGIARAVAAPGSVDAFDVRAGRIVYVALRPGRLQELYTMEDGKERCLTRLNEGALAGKALSAPERFTVTTADGTELAAWIIRPPDCDRSVKYPTILAIHGGPKTVYGETFIHEMQLLAGEGYIIVFGNPRGSSGRGNAFADIRGRYGTVDYDDLMAILDAAIARFPEIDADRLGVMGGSYGGFMTNWIIGHTDRFKAACSQRSIANWISKFCTTDIGYFFNYDQIGATPWQEDGKKLWWHSPLRYADRAVTPTLFIHSQEDYRCWIAEGIQMFTALRYHGTEARLVMFRGENHDLSRTGKPKHRLRRLEEILAWFNKHLKGGQ